jgi:hypothetical protein
MNASRLDRFISTNDGASEKRRLTMNHQRNWNNDEKDRMDMQSLLASLL